MNSSLRALLDQNAEDILGDLNSKTTNPEVQGATMKAAQWVLMIAVSWVASMRHRWIDVIVGALLSALLSSALIASLIAWRLLYSGAEASVSRPEGIDDVVERQVREQASTHGPVPAPTQTQTPVQVQAQVQAQAPTP
jgi:hypothetical protein